jgi:hypothetical protein
MVKKKGTAAAASVSTSTTGPKIIVAATKKVAPEASAATTKDAPGDWPASTMSKACSLGQILEKEGDVILPGSDSRPNPPAGFTVMFVAFLYRGLSLPRHEFFSVFCFRMGFNFGN